MGKLLRMITTDGAVMAAALDSTDIVNKAEKIHKTSAVMTAALGRLLTAASLMGQQLKGKDDSLTLRIKGNGPVQALVAVSDSDGYVRGYTTDPVIEIPLKENGKLDVSGAIGKTGLLEVVKDIGLKEPYCGSIPLVSGEIAEDITAYFAISEQLPTVCALGVLVNPDLTVRKAGGYLIQLLPGADEQAIDRLEANVKKMRPVTTLLDEGMDIEKVLLSALEGFNTECVSEQTAEYRCTCSKERVKKILQSVGQEELLSMADELPVIEVSCHFCNRRYAFTPSEVRALAQKKQRES